MASRITARQRECLDAIIAYIAEHTYPPTRQELCDIMGVKSKNAITQWLNILEDKGYIIVIPNTSRGIRVR